MVIQNSESTDIVFWWADKINLWQMDWDRSSMVSMVKLSPKSTSEGRSSLESKSSSA